MPEYRVGVIGIRNVGMGHVRAWANTPGAQVVAVADLDEDRRNRVAREVEGVRLFGDYRDLLDQAELDIVSVCLPTGIHERVVADCAAKGLHILCEKPPANNAEEAQRMAEAAKKAGVTLGYSLQQRFRPEVQAARRAAAEGVMGELYFGRIGYVRTSPWHVPNEAWRTLWRFDAEQGGGSLLDLGVHILDLTWFVMGCPKPVSVTGFLSSRMIPMMTEGLDQSEIRTPADDTAAALIRFEGGRAILLESSFGIYRPTRSRVYCELTGTEGGIAINENQPPELVKGEGERTQLELAEGPVGRDGMVRDFLAAVKEGRDPIVSADQGVTLMKMLDGIMASSKTGSSVSL